MFVLPNRWRGCRIYTYYVGGGEMPGVSTKTKSVTIRMPVELLERVLANAGRQNRSVSNYINTILATQVLRKR